MYKHSTTHRTLSRRLAALLAVLALLAALALPVYAEALDSATGTAQAEIGDTISDGTVTTENDSTAPEGKEAAKDSTANADGNNASENKDTNDNASPNTTGDSNTTADDAANDTPQILPDDNIDTTAGKTTTNDTLDTMDEDEDAEQDIVTRSADGAETADDAATDNGTAAYSYPAWVYVAVADNFGAGWTVKFNSNKAKENEQENWLVKQSMVEQKTLYDGRRVFGFELTQENCPNNGYSRIQFLPYNGNDQQNPIYEASSKWKDIKDFANKLYDAKKNEWVNYKPFDPTDHTAFSGKKMAFKNASTGDLTNVVAHFYEKDADGKLSEVERQNLNNNVSAGEKVDFTIPPKDKPCGFIQFTAGEPEKIISSIYNFYGQEVGTGEESFLYNEETQFCFVYSANNMAHWGTGEGQRTIYYDATFSKLSADTGYAIPSNVGGKVYYYLTSEKEGKAGKAGEMTRQTNDLYSVDIKDGYDHIIFGAYKPTSATNVAGRGNSTANLEIPDKYTSPCFYADTGDDSTYGGANGTRDGYWAEVNTLRDAETNKDGKTVVDVPQAEFKADSSTKYIDTTLYDYYSDWELNGNNRDNYAQFNTWDGQGNTFANNDNAYRNWVTFRQFDQALSDYYQDSTKTVLYPMYTGQFQPDATGNDGEWGFRFSGIADKLKLYGYSDDKNKFMAVNNSTIDVNGGGLGATQDKYYDDAFQGLTGDNLVDGEPVLYNTNLTVPYFNKDFLLKSNSKNAKLGEVYDNVSFPFTKRQGVFHNGNESSVEYWYFDSNDTTLYLKQDTGNTGYFLQKQENDKRTGSRNLKSNSDYHENGTFGFFPFNENSTDHQASTYNYGFGAKLKFQFTMNEDGQVYGTDGETKVPIKFFFSGDDDVWVYIDDELALDVGGDHGKVSGLLEFGQNKENKLVYTPYVSDVKASNAARMYQYDSRGKSVEYLKTGNNIPFHYKGTEKPITPGTHTLTMYYMERGMWESNMAIAFNFPDNNELQVQKIVDDKNVNELFAGCFDNQRFFNFTIRNQATHYGTVDTKTDNVSTINLLEPKKSSSEQKDFTATAKPATTTTDSGNIFEIVKNPPGESVGESETPLLKWYAKFKDLEPEPGSHKEDRYGKLKLSNPIDITGMSYLSFDIYVDSDKGDAALSNMYLQLRDSHDRQKGCLGKTFIGGKMLYGQVEMHNRQWITVKLSLDDMQQPENFDRSSVKELLFGCNYPREIYLRNIVFSAKAVPTKITGFTTKQDTIADYGSAKTGTLMPAANAQYTSDAEKGTMVVDKNGGFVLQNKEMVTFKDQFRRGSYLSINEQVDTNLFDTQWTIYEDGMPVESTTAGEGKKLTLKDNEPLSLENRPGTAPYDGRIELKYAEGEAAQNGNNYNGQKPDDKTIVFRSYAKPDATEADGETQLKVVFVNTVKTGSLTIVKQQAQDSADLKGPYHFKVRFTNVGGHALGDKKITWEFDLAAGASKELEGIPVGTRFTIEEEAPKDGSKLVDVRFNGGNELKVMSNNTVRGSISGTDTEQATVTFTNSKQETLDITGKKVWENADNSPMTEHPAAIYVQLQRRPVGETSESPWTPVPYRNETYTKVEQDHDGMNFSFLGLPAKEYDNGSQTRYEYRVVEGSVDKNVFHAVENGKTITIDEKVYCVTYNPVTVSKPDDSSNNAEQTVTITNTQQDPKFTLDVTKKSAGNDGEGGKQKLLAGVEFTLERLKTDGTGNTVVDSSFKCTGVTNDKGELMLTDSSGEATATKGFKELEAGTYRLTETKAAKDYNLLSEPITIIFSKDGKYQVGADVLTAAKPGTNYTGDDATGYTLALTVLNRKTPALPHTGADAPSLWLLIGLPLAVAGLLILVFRYNKKGGRTR